MLSSLRLIMALLLLIISMEEMHRVVLFTKLQKTKFLAQRQQTHLLHLLIVDSNPAIIIILLFLKVQPRIFSRTCFHRMISLSTPMKSKRRKEESLRWMQTMAIPTCFQQTITSHKRQQTSCMMLNKASQSTLGNSAAIAEQCQHLDKR